MSEGVLFSALNNVNFRRMVRTEFVERDLKISDDAFAEWVVVPVCEWLAPRFKKRFNYLSQQYRKGKFKICKLLLVWLCFLGCRY